MMLHRVGCRERTQFSFIQQTLHFTFWFKHSIWWYCHRRVGFVEGFSKIISMFILDVLMQLGPYLGWWAQRPNGLWPQNQGDFKPQCNRTFSGQAKKTFSKRWPYSMQLQNYIWFGRWTVSLNSAPDCLGYFRPLSICVCCTFVNLLY